jgi:hypothetical protein
MMKAELQAVPNTLTRHNFQDAFKKWQKDWEWCIHAEGDYSEVVNRPKVSFYQMAALVPKTMDINALYIYIYICPITLNIRYSQI